MYTGAIRHSPRNKSFLATSNSSRTNNIVHNGSSNNSSSNKGATLLPEDVDVNSSNKLNNQTGADVINNSSISSRNINNRTTGAVVDNEGWAWVALDPDAGAPEEEYIRGFKVERRGAAGFRADASGGTQREDVGGGEEET